MLYLVGERPKKDQDLDKSSLKKCGQKVKRVPPPLSLIIILA
jgi:hypothetical protein